MFQLRNFFLKKKPEFPVHLEFTKDWEQLQHSNGWLFFEYGELKRQFPFHEHLGVEVRTHAYTHHKSPLWVWNDDQDVFPIYTDIQHPTMPVRKGHIMGEVYLIPTEKIPHLDAYRQNGVQFVRKNVSLILPNQTMCRAFSYVGNKEYWKPKMEWAFEFYKGRERSAFSLVEPTDDRHNRNWLGFYTNYTEESIYHSNRPAKSFIGILSNGFTPDKEQDK